MKLALATDRFTRQLAANGRSAHTRAAYRRDLAALARFMGGNPDLGKITPDCLAGFLTSDAVLLAPQGQPATKTAGKPSQAGKPRSPISVNRTKSALRSFFAFCVDSRYLRENPARLIKSARTSRAEPCTLSEDEVGRLRHLLTEVETRLADRDRLILEILLGTGIRLGSLVALNIGDIDLKQGAIHIRSKGGGRDKVFLNPSLQRLLGAYLKKNAPEANTGRDMPLIRNRSGSRLTARPIQLWFAKLCREAGIEGKVSVHSLRHTFATNLYHRTGDLYLVQRALGHRQIGTTEIYARVSDESLRRAIATRN
jgi:integrase/recombinase XerC